VGGEG
jgi:hypothetical protein